MHDPQAPESRPPVCPQTVPTPWKFQLTKRWNGAGLFAQQEPRSSAQAAPVAPGPRADGPTRSPPRGRGRGPPPPPRRSSLPTPGGDPASPGLSGAHNREVRNHGFAVASAGGHRGHLGRPRAPGLGSPAASPRPGHVHDARAASRNKGRRVARAQSRWACPAGRSRSGSRHRRFGCPAYPPFPPLSPALTKAGPAVLTGICLLIEDCGLIIQPVPRRHRRRRQGRRRWASRGGGGGDAGGGGTRRPCSELPEERRRAGRSPEPMRAPRRPCVTSPLLYSRCDVRTGGGQSPRGTPAARGGVRDADVTRGGCHRCEPVDEWRGGLAGCRHQTLRSLEPRVCPNVERRAGGRNPVARGHSSVALANGLPWHLRPRISVITPY
ncbi:uncharacterized protein LOC116089406 [Mastomys coucha]|uniref:uncharacterized protein LOC116089406 n=1 Tax=Mastomys coucha TaxID=35658 RepID=UPI0012617DAD|nr:uncharacterized protein LOC116089406 [Mastomys coucha]